MRHRFFPFITGAWHSVPRRVFAQQRIDRRKGKGSWVCRLIGLMSCFTGSPPPSGVDVPDNGLSSFVDVDVLDRDLLRPAPTHLRESFELGGIGS